MQIRLEICNIEFYVTNLFLFYKFYNKINNILYCFHSIPLDENTFESVQLEDFTSTGMELSTGITNDVLTTTSEISYNKIQENTGIALIKE